MSLILNLQPSTEEKLRAMAQRAGLPVESFAAQELEKMTKKQSKLREILGTANDDAPAEISDHELTGFLNQVIHESRKQS